MLLVAVLCSQVAVGISPVGSGLPGDVAVEVDEVALFVDVDSSGTAAWSIEYRTRLDSTDRRDAFEAQKDDVEADPDEYVATFQTQIAGLLDSASEATGREMELTDVAVSAETRHIPQEYGVVTYRFTWVGFAAVDSPELRVGDAIAGLFLDEASSMRVRWPESYELVDARPTPDGSEPHSVTWRGPVDFAPDEPLLVVSSDPAADSTPSAVTTTVGNVALWGLFLTALAALVWWFSAGRPVPTDRTPPSTDKLLSNEEQVLRLLDERDGRLKQQQIATELDWTETKTSKVVADMRESGTIEVFRLGRENVVSLPGQTDI